MNLEKYLKSNRYKYNKPPVYKYHMEIDEKYYNMTSVNLDHIYIGFHRIRVKNQVLEDKDYKNIYVLELESPVKLYSREYGVTDSPDSSTITPGIVIDGSPVTPPSTKSIIGA